MSNAKDIILLIQKSGGSAAHEISAKELLLKSFPHPRGYGMLIIDLDDQFYELQSTQPRKFSSWFINQRVSSSQTIFMANVFDPRFLCLPFLEKSAGKFSPLDQIIFLEGKYARFPFSRASTWKLGDMCDVNDKLGDDMILYRHNEVKVLEWLNRKVELTAKAIQRQRQSKSQKQNTTFAAGFNVSKQSSGVTNSVAEGADTVAPSREDVVQAIEIISDYLTPATAQKLLQAHNVNAADLQSKAAAAASLKRKSDWEQELELEQETLAYSTAASKINSVGTSGGGNAVSSSVSAVKTVSSASKASTKANSAAAKGTKSIQSFFGAKK